MLTSAVISAVSAIIVPDQAFATPYACYCSDGNADGADGDGVLVFLDDDVSATPPEAGDYAFAGGIGTLTVIERFDDFAKGYSSGGAPWYEHRDNITRIVFQDDIATASMDYWFEGCAITELDTGWWGALSMDNVTSCKCMFSGCTKLTNATLAGLGSPVLTDASSMFGGCTALANITLSAWSSPKLATAAGICKDCRGLALVNIAGWNAASLTDMTSAFEGCTSLTEVGGSGTEFNLVGWQPSSLATMTGLFKNCQGLKSVDLSGWSCPATTVTSLFENCVALEEASLQGADFSKATAADAMFKSCTSLTSLNLAGANFSNAASVQGFLQNCSSLTSADLSGWVAGAKAGESWGSGIFDGCAALEEIKVGPSWPSNAVATAANFPAGRQGDVSASYLWLCVETGKYVTRSRPADPETAVPAPGDVGLQDAATYRAGVAAGLPLAVFCADAATLYFYTPEQAAMPTDHAGHDVTAVYGGFYDFEATSSAEIGWADIREDVTTVAFEDDLAPINTVYWFYGMKQLTRIEGFSHLNLNDITSVRSWFDGCSALDFSEAGGGVAAYLASSSCPKLVSARYAFDGCSNLTDEAMPDLLRFMSGDVSPALQDAYAVFIRCTGITNVDISDLELPAATNLCNVFRSCTGLVKVNANGLKLPSATDLSNAFYQCTGLTKVDISDLELPAVTTLSYAFGSCSALTEVKATDMKLPAVTDLKYMFGSCSSLKEVDMSGLELSKSATGSPTASYAFNGCTKLAKVDLSGANLGKLYYANYVFNGCTKLGKVDLSGANLGKLYEATYAFQNCTSLASVGMGDDYAVNVQGMKAPSLYNASYMFSGCTGLEKVCLDGAEFASLYTVERLYYKCTKLVEMSLVQAKFPKLTTVTSLFEGCTVLAKACMDGAEFNVLQSASSVFYEKTSLTEVSLSQAKFPALMHAASAFYGCTKLAKVDLTGAVFSSFGRTGSSAYSLFWSCYALKSFGPGCAVDTEGATLPLPPSISRMFMYCTALESVDFSNLNGSAMEGCEYLFFNCNKLGTIKVNNTISMNRHSWAKAYFPVGYSGGKTCNYLWYCEESMEVVCSATNTVPPTVAGAGASGSVATFRAGTGADRGGALAAGYFADRNELRFYRLSAGDTKAKHDGRTVTNFYVGAFEHASYTSSSNAPWYGVRANVKGIVFEDDLAPKSMAYWFRGCTQLEALPERGRLDLSRTTSMRAIFWGCTSLADADVAAFLCPEGEDAGGQEGEPQDSGVPALTSMETMFQDCTALESVSLAGLEAPVVTTVASMTYGCTALSRLDLSGFAAPKLATGTNMIEKSAPLRVAGSEQFVREAGGGSGIVLDDYELAGNFKMFNGLTRLERVDLSGCAAPELSDGGGMFVGCTALQEAVLGDGERGWRCPALTTAFGMFGACTSLERADLRGWQAPNCSNLVEAFARCSSLTTCLTEGAVLADGVTLYATRKFADTDPWGIWQVDTANYTTSTYEATRYLTIFSGCASLRYAGSAAYVASMGQGADFSALCSATSWERLFRWANTSYTVNGKKTNYLDIGMVPLVGVDFSGLSCPNLTTVQYLFSGATRLESANLDMAAPKLANTSDLFLNCTSLGKITVGESWSKLSSDYGVFPAGRQGGNAARCLWYCEETGKYVSKLDVATTRIPTVAEANPGGEAATYLAGVHEDTLVGAYTQANKTLSLFRTSEFPAAEHGGAAVSALYIAPEETACARDADAPWNGYRSAIAKVAVEDGAAITAPAGAGGGRSPVTYWFDNMTALTSITGLSEIDVSGAGSLSGMFAGCPKLAELNLDGWDTAAVTDMSGLLAGCAALERVQVGAGFSQAGVPRGKEATFPNQTDTTQWYEVLSYELVGEGANVVIPTNETGHALVYINDEPCFYAVFCAGDRSLTFVGDTVRRMPQAGEACDAAGGQVVSAAYKVWEAGSLVPGAYGQWAAQRHEVRVVRFPYPVSAPPSVAHWFEGFDELERFEGLSNLVTADTTDFAHLFDGCASLASLDFSGQDTRKAADMAAMVSGCTRLESFSVGESFAQSGVAAGREARFPVIAGEEWVDGSGGKHKGGDVVPDGAATYARAASRHAISVTAPEKGIQLGAEKDGALAAVSGSALSNVGENRVSVVGWEQADEEPFVGVEEADFPAQGGDGGKDGVVSWYAKVRTQLAPTVYEARYISADAAGIYPGGTSADGKDGAWTMAAAGDAGGADKLVLSVDDGMVEMEPKWWEAKPGSTESEAELAGTLTWQLAPSEATVTFVANGGPDVAAQEVPIGDRADAPEYVPDGGTEPVAYEEGVTTAVIEGLERTFAGWYADPGLTQKWDFGTRVTGSKALYAKWVGDPKVRFELEGGAWTDDEVANPQGVAAGGKVVRPSNPSKLGGVLDYWYAWDPSSASGIHVWDFENDTVTDDMVLHAHYKDSATVTFDPNGGTLDGEGAAQSVVLDLAADALPSYALGRMDVAAPDGSGCVFDGWALKADAGAGDAHYRAGDKVPLLGDVVLYAVWGTLDTGEDGSSVSLVAGDGSLQVTQHLASEKLNGPVASRGIVYMGSDEAMDSGDADLALVQNNMSESYTEGMTQAYGKAREGREMSDDLALLLDASGAEAPLMKSAAAARGYLVYADGNGDEWVSYSVPALLSSTEPGAHVEATDFAWHRLHTATFGTMGGSVGTTPRSLAPQRVADGYPVYASGEVTRAGASFDAWCSDASLASEWAVAGATAGSRANAMRATGDVTLRARWLVTVKFDSNDGSDVADVETVADRTISAPAAPTLSGCAFAGWYTDDGTFKSAWNFSKGKVAADTELHAKWTCTVSFAANGGSGAPAAQTVARHAKAAKPTREPTRTGYDFTGWYTSENGGTTLSDDTWDFDQGVEEGVTLYAGWKRSVCTVTFDTAGGTSVDAQRVEHGDKAQKPADPELEGYSFTGWYSDQARTTEFDFDGAITRNTTVYAGWEGSYYVDFYSDGELHARVPAVEGKPVSRPDDPESDARTGWHLTGWRLSGDGGETMGDEWNFEDPVDGDMKLYAAWEKNVYPVVFNTVGGSPAVPAQAVEHGGVAVRPADPILYANRFMGWYSDPLYVNEYDFSTPVTGMLELYAKWEMLRQTVSFEPNGGEAVAPQELTYGEKASEPDAARTGYKDPVWYADAGLTRVYDFSAPVRSSFTLYAGWTPVEYSVGFEANFPEDSEEADGSVAMAAATATYDQEAELPENTYACKGYTFAGWNTKIDGSGESFADGASVENLSSTDGETVYLYAQWAEGYADYTVRHWQQDAAGDGYTEVASDRQAFTGKVGETTEAVANSYTGFTARTVEQQTIGPKGDTVVDVYYDRNTYKVTFDENGHGEAPEAYAGVRYGATIEAPEAPEADGVEFAGWYRDPGGASAWDFDADTVTGPVTLYAKWAQAPYVIRFEPNYPGDTEADFDNVAMDPIRADIGRSYRLTFNTLAAKGYTFTGWNTEADGSGDAYADHELVSDLSETPGATVPLYAQWTAGPTTYTVEHYQQDAAGDGYALAESEVLEGVTHGTTEAAARSYEGFKEASAFEQATVGPKRDTVVKIYYDRLTYDVTFDANGHGAAPAASSARHGAALAWPTAEPEVEGLAFAGWYTDAACAEAYDFSSPVTSSFTLHAKWTDQYVTVRYAANNAVDGTAEIRVPAEGQGQARARAYASFHGSSAAGWARYRPARTVGGAVAYQSVFLGWSGSDGKDYAPGDAIPAEDDFVLTARWGELLADSVSADMYASGDAMPDGVSLADGEGAVALFKASLKASPNMDGSMVTFKGYSRGYDGAKAAMATSSTSKALGDYRVSGADGEERSYEVEQRLGASSTSEAVSFSPALQVRDADGAEWGLYLRGNSFSYESLAENAGGAHSWSGAGFVASRDAGGVKDATLKRYETAEWAYQADESYDATADGGPATVAKDASLGTWEWGGDVLSTLSTHSVSASAALPGDGATKLVSDGEGAAADALSTASSDASGGSDGDTSAGSASAGAESPGSGASDSAAPAGDEGDGAASAGAGGDDPASDAARQSAISVTGPLD